MAEGESSTRLAQVQGCGKTIEKLGDAVCPGVAVQNITSWLELISLTFGTRQGPFAMHDPEFLNMFSLRVQTQQWQLL